MVHLFGGDEKVADDKDEQRRDTDPGIGVGVVYRFSGIRMLARKTENGHIHQHQYDPHCVPLCMI
ncbi:hypothetical protein D3C81_2178490 [compost metagenome]